MVSCQLVMKNHSVPKKQHDSLESSNTTGLTALYLTTMRAGVPLTYLMAIAHLKYKETSVMSNLIACENLE